MHLQCYTNSLNGSGWLHPDFQGNPHLRIFAFEFACSFGFQFCQRGTILHRLLVSVVCSMPCAVVSVGSVVLNLNDKSSLLLVGMVVVAIASLHREYLLVLQGAILVVHLEVLLLGIFRAPVLSHSSVSEPFCFFECWWGAHGYHCCDT